MTEQGENEKRKRENVHSYLRNPGSVVVVVLLIVLVGSTISIISFLALLWPDKKKFTLTDKDV
jgi:ABC-type uncharacterized transport system fused permease/ATPase subunit